MKWFLKWWYARGRALDLEILWPACKQKAPDLRSARMAFAMHALNDPAWLCLGEDEILAKISQMT